MIRQWLLQPHHLDGYQSFLEIIAKQSEPKALTEVLMAAAESSSKPPLMLPTLPLPKEDTLKIIGFAQRDAGTSALDSETQVRLNTPLIGLACLTLNPFLDCAAHAGVSAEASCDGGPETEGGARGVHRAGQHQCHPSGPPL